MASQRRPRRPAWNNLLGIYKVITGTEESEIVADFATARGYGDLKATVAEAVIAELNPIRERYQELMKETAELDRACWHGAPSRRGRSLNPRWRR